MSSERGRLIGNRNPFSLALYFKQFKRFVGNRAHGIGLAIILFFIFIAMFAPYLAPYNPKQVGTPFQEPNASHLLGTDDMGKDLFSQLIFGTRISLFIGILAAIISIIIGVAVGLLAGYYRGFLEDVLMGTTDVFLMLPALPVMIIIASYLEPSIWNIVLVVSLLWWCPTARVVYAKVIQIRGMNYIDSGKVMGMSDLAIMLKHVLLNSREIVFAKFPMAVASAMLAEASLAFIGLGDPFNISWGVMINNAFTRGGFAQHMYWWYLPPGILISVVAFSFILLAWPTRRNIKLLEVVG